MREDGKPYDGYAAKDGATEVRVYQGFKFEDMPSTYVIGDDATFA